MLDAPNQMIRHKHEETLHCLADAGHHVTVPPLSLLHVTMLTRFRRLKTTSEQLRTPARHYINATPSTLADWTRSSRYLCESPILQ